MHTITRKHIETTHPYVSALYETNLHKDFHGARGPKLGVSVVNPAKFKSAVPSSILDVQRFFFSAVSERSAGSIPAFAIGKRRA